MGMSQYCEDCGCKMSGGICSNCHEELFIMENQSEFIDFPLSEEFLQKADKQKKETEESRGKYWKEFNKEKK
jgi:hypothetical protein